MPAEDTPASDTVIRRTGAMYEQVLHLKGRLRRRMDFRTGDLFGRLAAAGCEGGDELSV
jgi:hypothetical protein